MGAEELHRWYNRGKCGFRITKGHSRCCRLLATLTPPAAPNTGSDGLVVVVHGASQGVAVDLAPSSMARPGDGQELDLGAVKPCWRQGKAVGGEIVFVVDDVADRAWLEVDIVGQAARRRGGMVVIAGEAPRCGMQAVELCLRASDAMQAA